MPTRIRTRTRFRLEALEDRTALATLTVLNGNDAGNGSLRKAISDAKSGDTILFAPSVQLVTLTTGELSVTKSLSIVGPGPSRLTVSGNDTSRVLRVESGASLRVSGLTISRGRSAPGEIVAAGVGDPLGGGGVRNEAGATLSMVGVNFDRNQAVGTVGSDVFGGGLLNLGTATLNSSVFSNNKVSGGGSFTNIGGSAGGAISNYAGATLTVSLSTFRDNVAVSAAGNAYYALGGAVEVNAGPDGFDPEKAVPSTATFSNSVFTNNLAQGGAGATANGGAILVEGIGTRVTVTNSVITGNRSIGGDGGVSQGIGGGLMNIGTLDLVNSVVSYNLARGGDNPDFEASRFAGGAFGGGLNNNYLGALRITNSVFVGNVAQGGSAAAGPSGAAFGGAVSNSGQGAVMTATNTAFVSNRAVGGAGGGGGGLENQPGGAAFGGGIDASNQSTTTLNSSQVVSNAAVGGAGSAGRAGADAMGGGLAVGLNALYGLDEDARLTLNRSVVVGNVAQGGAGGAGAAGGAGKGGGLFLISPPTTPPQASAALNATQVIANSAVGGAKGSGGTQGEGIGGGVYNDRGAFAFDAATLIVANKASTRNNNIFSI